MSKVKIILNGEERFLEQRITVAQLILDLELDIKKIAVEKDLQIVILRSICKLIVLSNPKQININRYIIFI